MREPTVSDTGQEDEASPAKPPSRARRILKRMLIVSAVTVTISLIIAGVLLYRINAAPAQWVETQTFWEETGEAELTRMAEAAERRVFNQVAARPPSPEDTEAGPHTVEVTLDEANAWLRQRFPEWAENRGMAIPPQVTNSMLATEGDLLVLAFEVEADRSQPYYFSVLFDITFQPEDQGESQIRVADLRLGQQQLPVNTLLDTMSRFDDRFGDVAAYLKQLSEGVPFEPVFTVPGDEKRLVRVTAMRLNPETIELDLVPVQPYPPPPSPGETAAAPPPEP